MDVINFREPADSAGRRGRAILDIASRLDRLPSAPSIWWIVCALSIGSFCEIYDAILTPFLATGLTKEGLFKLGTAGLFGLNDVGTFIAATFTGLWIGTLAFSYISDRWGRRPAMRYSLIFYTAMSVLLGMQTTAAGIDIFRFLSGLGMGIQIVAVDCCIAEITPKAIRGRAFAVSTAIQLSASPVGAILAVYLIPSAPLGLAGWRWMAFMLVVFAAAALWIQRKLPESPRWLAEHGDHETGSQIVEELEQRIRRSGRTVPPALSSQQQALLAAAEPELSRPAFYKRLLMMSLANFLQAIGYYGFSNWVPTLLQAKGADLKQSLVYTAAILVAYPVAPLFFCFFADRFERKHMLILGCLSAAGCGVLFAQQSTPALLIAFGIMVTLSNNLLAFSLHAYQAEIFPTRTRARSVGFVYSFTRLSTIFSGYIVAYLLVEVGVSGVFTFLDGALALAALTVWTLGPRTRGMALEQIA